ncbi:hypothetical protein [Phaeocystidibacter marisrubri]|uniref:Uncharacterized protein n=1 Tax=Phaeocystidibacter marisrubri TaxID=1577780 RepID=A0A6L3ZIS3_9FLAO|nr:hypothetical protein [Phaeocystidibacter marisrubri]KAB2817916.1 hypothetical protein F8C82_05795 [Phaeocystidibacter marisrubri]GGH72880.1 hypothetical protein GCM10011318_17320 [Phaeocystidibacter marisrubri]
MRYLSLVLVAFAFVSCKKSVEPEELAPTHIGMWDGDYKETYLIRDSQILQSNTSSLVGLSLDFKTDNTVDYISNANILSNTPYVRSFRLLETNFNSNNTTWVLEEMTEDVMVWKREKLYAGGYVEGVVNHFIRRE